MLYPMRRATIVLFEQVSLLFIFRRWKRKKKKSQRKNRRIVTMRKQLILYGDVELI